jgi:hypothetical protein
VAWLEEQRLGISINFVLNPYFFSF